MLLLRKYVGPGRRSGPGIEYSHGAGRSLAACAHVAPPFSCGAECAPGAWETAPNLTPRLAPFFVGSLRLRDNSITMTGALSAGITTCSPAGSALGLAMSTAASLYRRNEFSENTTGFRASTRSRLTRERRVRGGGNLLIFRTHPTVGLSQGI